MLKHHYNVKLFVLAFICTLFSQGSISQNLSDEAPLSSHALPEFHAKYAIQFYGVKAAEAHYKLSYTDSGYKFTQDTKLSGLASMFADDTVSAVSIVDVIDDKLLLTKYTYIQTGKEKNRNEDISIHWDTTVIPAKGKITGTVRSKNIDLETDTAVWEALSFQLPLMIDANKDIKNYPYKALLKGKIDTYNFVLTSSKKISFANKEYTALQMVRTDPHKKRQLHIWLIPELHNIPVKIENFRKGKLHSKIELESVQFNNAKIYLGKQIEDDDEF